MKRRTFVATTGTGIAALLAGCGGGSGSQSTDRPDNIQWAKDYTWNPVRLEVSTGTEVKWVNDDSTPHTVTSAQFHDKAKEWDFEEDLSASGEVTHTFDEAGVYEHYSTSMGDGGKSGMCGAVIVGDATLDADLPCEGGD
jgi:plastocyanin